MILGTIRAYSWLERGAIMMRGQKTLELNKQASSNYVREFVSKQHNRENQTNIYFLLLSSPSYLVDLNQFSEAAIRM